MKFTSILTIETKHKKGVYLERKTFPIVVHFRVIPQTVKDSFVAHYIHIACIIYLFGCVG